MGKFIAYTVLGTLASFAVIVYLSLWPHLERLPGFADGITPEALLRELPSFGITLAISWIAWWSVSGILSLTLLAVGKHTWIVLFICSLAAICGITALIT